MRLGQLDVGQLSLPFETPPMSSSGLTHGCPARFVLEGVHGIDSTRFQVVANQPDAKRNQSRAASEYRFSCASEACSLGDGRSACGRIRSGPGPASGDDEVAPDRDALWAAF